MNTSNEGNGKSRKVKKMIKAVNVKNYRFGKRGNTAYIGFAMLDTDTDTFVSLDGIKPYVLTTKKLVESCIIAEWPATLRRVQHA